MTPVLCYYSVQTSRRKVAMRIRKIFLPFSSKLAIQGKMLMDEGLFTSSTVPRHLTSISLLGDVWMLTKCTLTFTFLFFLYIFFFKEQHCFWLLRHLHCNYVGLKLIFPAILTCSWHSTSALGPHTLLVFWGGVKEIIIRSPLFTFTKQNCIISCDQNLIPGKYQ